METPAHSRATSDAGLLDDAHAPLSKKEDEESEDSDESSKPAVDRERIMYLWARVRNVSRILGRLNKMSKDIQIFGACRKEFDKSPIADPNKDKDLQHIPTLILRPDSPLRRYWSLLMIFILLYTALVTPYRICFVDDVVGVWLVIDIITDAIFVFDIVLTFISAFEEEDGTLISDYKRICRRYLAGWFTLDVIGCLPISYINIQSSDTSSSSSDNYNRLLRLLRVPRMYRLLRVFRLMKMTRVFRSNALIRKLINTLKMNNGIVRLLRFGVTIIILVHVTGCFWFFLAKMDDFGPDTWVVRYSYSSLSNIELYILSIYYVFTTLTTVGFGDIAAYTINERVFAIILMGFGVGFYSYTISNLSTIMENMDIRSANLKTRLATLNEFAKDSNLPKELKAKIRRHIVHNHEQNIYSWFSHDSLLKELPASLRTEISLHMHQKIVERVGFFQDKDPGFISYIVPTLKNITFKSGEVMFQEGDYADEVYFIIFGRVNLKASNGVVFKTYVQGSYFGEVEILENTNRTYTVQVSSPTAELLAMSKAIFWSMMEEFPQVAQELIETARLRNLKNTEAKLHALSLLQDRPIEALASRKAPINTFIEKVQTSNTLVKNPRRRISLTNALGESISGNKSIGEHESIKSFAVKVVKPGENSAEDQEKEAYYTKLREKYSKPKQFALSMKEDSKNVSQEGETKDFQSSSASTPNIITPNTRKSPLTFSSQILKLAKPQKFCDPTCDETSLESPLQSPTHIPSADAKLSQKFFLSSEKLLPATGLSPDLDRIINALKGKEAFLDDQFATTDRLLEMIESRQEDLTGKLAKLAGVLKRESDTSLS